MGKTIKHTNMLRPNPGLEQEGYQYLRIPCRGCSMRSRERVWEGFVSSISSSTNRAIDNSYLTLEEEPSNEYDPNAVMVVCRGEFFGTMGYIGKEYTADVKQVLNTCKSYRVDMVDESEVGNSQIALIVTWK